MGSMLAWVCRVSSVTQKSPVYPVRKKKKEREKKKEKKKDGVAVVAEGVRETRKLALLLYGFYLKLLS